MATPIMDWPIGVPYCVTTTSPNGGLRDNRLSFESDSRMPPKERPVSSWTPEVYSVELEPMSIAQFQLFQSWYKSDLRFGVYPFRWFHPITREASPWKIMKGDPPYQVRKIGPIPIGSDARRISVSFSVSSHPGSFSAGRMAQEGADLVNQELSDRIAVGEGYVFSGT